MLQKARIALPQVMSAIFNNTNEDTINKLATLIDNINQGCRSVIGVAPETEMVVSETALPVLEYIRNNLPKLQNAVAQERYDAFLAQLEPVERLVAILNDTAKVDRHERTRVADDCRWWMQWPTR